MRIWLGPRDVEGRRRRVKCGHDEPTIGEQAGEGPGAAADVQDASRTELVNHGRVRVQVTAIRVKPIVELGETPLREDRIKPWPVR